MGKPDKIFEEFESSMNQMLKDGKEFWHAARVIAGNLIEKYSEDTVSEASVLIRTMPNKNARWVSSLLQSELAMMHIKFVEPDGKEYPMTYQRVFE